ncbi:hypothetical protein [Streptomyces sp. NPDC045369]|uniref:hypothetical protein n=1 Tax=Streptomyces sp. NPDC045369 TaxID=3155732 RepID=UPI0033E0719F
MPAAIRTAVNGKPNQSPDIVFRQTSACSSAELCLGLGLSANYGNISANLESTFSSKAGMDSLARLHLVGEQPGSAGWSLTGAEASRPRTPSGVSTGGFGACWDYRLAREHRTPPVPPGQGPYAHSAGSTVPRKGPRPAVFEPGARWAHRC